MSLPRSNTPSGIAWHVGSTHISYVVQGLCLSFGPCATTSIMGTCRIIFSTLYSRPLPTQRSESSASQQYRCIISCTQTTSDE